MDPQSHPEPGAACAVRQNTSNSPQPPQRHEPLAHAEPRRVCGALGLIPAYTASAERHTPLDVFYVVETSGDVSGERRHSLSSPLFETRLQAETARVRLQTADASGNFSVWQGTTYIEPAEWAYEVVMADGSVIVPRDRNVIAGLSHGVRRSDTMRPLTVRCNRE